MSVCHRPLVQQGHAAARPVDAVPLAGGELWFTHVERISRGAGSQIVPAQDLDGAVLHRLSAARDPIAGLDMACPQIMGILNTTPDSFSDGGVHNSVASATASARAMVAAGAAILDVGGESTRPGARYVEPQDEIARTAPVIEAIGAETGALVSIDTRKAPVARAAVAAGAGLVNDVSGFTFDDALAPFCADAGMPVCVMHAQGDPATMQQNPQYDHVLLDVFDFLARQIAHLEELGIPRGRIIVDPGIGFGKTQDHNLTLLRNISVFHDLGCPILLGASRKRFVGEIGQEPQADRRGPGSIAVALAALAQGVQIIRVHDVLETAQALRLWSAVR